MWIPFGVFAQDCGLEVKHQIVHKYCEGEDGAELVLSVKGGFPPYSYAWNTGAKSNIIQLSNDGVVSAKITDRRGCEIQFSTEYTAISTFKIKNVNHERQTDGTYRIIVDTSGGIPPYRYYWFGPEIQNGDTNILTNALPGDYQLVVQDSKNCMLSTPHQIVAQED